jgi:endonuclease/exonuclease/phosphatase family metal-dependent hydrolase
MIWNIGYAGLGRDMDFFYDGGKMVRPPRPRVEENLSAIQSFIQRQTDIDFFLFQEVDQSSKRSYQINQVLRLSRAFPGFHSSFGKNYDVRFVPVPVLDPLGAVRSGLLTLSRFEPLSVDRHAFPGNYAWPRGLFMLDRCFLVSRFRLDNKKELVVINTHNSAYDDGGLRIRQTAYLKEFLIKEVEQGNFIVVGGDWNQCPPGFVPEFASNIMDHDRRMDIDPDYIEKWSWAYDKTIPTNRRLAAPYDARTSPTTVIDFFLVSPNVEVKQVRGIHLDFEHSDHHPVKLKIKLTAS